MKDIFDSHTRSLTSPPENGTEVIPDDAVDLTHVTRAVYVGGSGDLAVRLPDGTDLTFANMSAGALLPIRAVRVLATGTTATRIVGLW